MPFASLFNRSKRNLRTNRRRHAPFVTEALEERILLSHYRYGNLSWEPAAAANTIQFHYQQAWRLSAFGGGVGDIVSEGDLFNYGDGTSDTITLKILSVNAAEDNFVAEAGTGTGASFTPGFVHTYSARATTRPGSRAAAGSRRSSITMTERSGTRPSSTSAPGTAPRSAACPRSSRSPTTRSSNSRSRGSTRTAISSPTGSPPRPKPPASPRTTNRRGSPSAPQVW